MRVLFADKLAPLAAERLEAEGHEVVADPSLKDDALREALAAHRPDVLVVRSTKVTREHLAASSTLSLVVRAGAGVNTIDLDAAGRLGVFVSNCPGKNAVAVAELVMGLLLAVDRHLADNVIDARAGRWNKAAWSKADGLKGRTLGILGMGSIGRAVAQRAKAFEMEVVAWSRSLTPDAAAALGVRHAATPLDVASQADAITVHTAMTPATKGLVSAELLAAMRDGGIVINTARAGVVDEDALLDALQTRGFRAGLDVFSDEPSGKTGAFSHPLAQHPSVVLTHHIGASTQEAQDAVAAEAARVICGYARDGSPPNCVNLEDETQATHGLVVRHLDQVGVLAGVLDALRVAGINVQEMENTIFAGGEAAIARIFVDSDPSGVVDTVDALEHVLHVAAVSLPKRDPGVPA